MKLYVARHGQTVWNVRGKVCGVTDIELTDEGKEQAKILAEKVSGCKVGIILASPLKRAQQTAGIIAERNALSVITEPLLTEQDYGIYEGADRRSEGFLSNKRQFAFRYPGGESMMQVAYRIYGLIDRVKEQYYGKNVLFVTHGGVCRVIRTYFMDMTNDEYFNYSADNCQLEEYDL